MKQLNKKELKVKQIIVRFLKNYDIYPQFIKEFNKGYRKFIREYYLNVENFDITKTSFNAFVKRINEGKQNTGILNEAFDWDYSENPDMWYEFFYEDKELIQYINDRIK